MWPSMPEDNEMFALEIRACRRKIRELEEKIERMNYPGSSYLPKTSYYDLSSKK